MILIIININYINTRWYCWCLFKGQSNPAGDKIVCIDIQKDSYLQLISIITLLYRHYSVTNGYLQLTNTHVKATRITNVNIRHTVKWNTQCKVE